MVLRLGRWVVVDVEDGQKALGVHRGFWAFYELVN